MVDVGLYRETTVDAAESDYANYTKNYNYCTLANDQPDEGNG